MLIAKDISFQTVEHHGLINISHQFVPQATTIISGTSGSGKTLFFSILAGIRQPHEGDILIDDKSLINSSTKQLYDIRKTMGIIFQIPAIISNLSVFENLKLTVDFYFSDRSIEERDFLIKSELTKFKLINFQDKRPDLLSKGQLYLLAMIRAFISSPKYLLWDGPFVMIDDLYHPQIIQRMHELKKNGSTIILFTNEKKIIKDHADHLFQIEDGQMRSL